MVRRLIDTYVRMYGKILESAEKMDIHTLDQACDNIDRTVGYIRKIIIKIPTIVDTKRKKVLKNEYEFHQKKKERKKYPLTGFYGYKVLVILSKSGSYHKSLEESCMVKYRSDNTRRIKTQDFGENKYSKNIGDNTIRF